MMKITEVLGIPPLQMLARGLKTKRYFSKPDESVEAYERIKTEKVSVDRTFRRLSTYFFCYELISHNHAIALKQNLSA